MIASVLWKEYREHRVVWATLAGVGFAALVGVPWAFPPESSQALFYQDGLVGVALALAWAYGIVCGSMLLAGEEENGTQSFLDLLPAGRRPLWLAKVLAGGLFVTLQAGVLALLVVLKGFVLPTSIPFVVLALLFAAALGLGWGLCCAARAKNVLSCIGWAIFTQLLLLPVLTLTVGIPLAVVGAATGKYLPLPLALFLGAALGLLLPWPISALRWCAADFDRTPVPPRPDRPRRHLTASWRAAYWLAKRQARGFAWGLVLFCLAASFPVAAVGLLLWPLFSLLVGVLCGVTVFSDEQGGSYRFLGDQRLPLTRLWLVKAGLRLGVALLGLAALLLASVVSLLIDLGQHPLRVAEREFLLARLFHTPLIGTTIPAGLFLFAPALYGFAVGHVCGILLRKTLVAVVVSLGLSAMVLSLWAPAFVAGGLRAWQVLLVPLVLLAGARLVLRAWTADRLVSRETAGRLVGVVVGCALLTAAGLWYRVAEMPDVPEPAEFPAFVTRIPKPEENEAGQAIRTGLARLREQSTSWKRDRDSFILQADRVVTEGWPANPNEGRALGEWLDKVFADDWWRRLAEACGKPLGVVEDPRLRTVAMADRNLEPALDASRLLPARGLMLQQKGDPAAFVEDLDIALTMVRNLENFAPGLTVNFAQAVQSNQLRAVTRWLEALPNDAGVLRRAAAVLARHRQWMPPTPWDVELVEYLIARNSMDQPQEWLRGRLASGSRAMPVEEAELLANAWRVPWEQERQRRLLRALHWGRDRVPQAALDYLPFVTPNFFRGADALRAGRIHHRAALEAAVLQVALRRYQAEKGHPAKALAALVPDYLPAIPADPFDGQPFRYRLSQGERIVWAVQAPVGEEFRNVPAGQGILWCVGPDGHDDGGIRHGGTSRNPPGEDVIFLVPLPARQ